jgi:hypothetical protein
MDLGEQVFIGDEVRNLQTMELGTLIAFSFEQIFGNEYVYVDYRPYLIRDEITGLEYWGADWNLEKVNEILSIN